MIREDKNDSSWNSQFVKEMIVEQNVMEVMNMIKSVMSIKELFLLLNYYILPIRLFCLKKPKDQFINIDRGYLI